ncbi:MAG: chorismate synthase [Candidatus Limimorpha sp.]
MNTNSIGKMFCLTTFGESHGPAVGGVIDGCPSGLLLDKELIDNELKRRRPGRGKNMSSRSELDSVEFLSGLSEGVTTGAPIAFIVRNNDCKSSDYDALKDVFRPSHADFTYHGKYGIRDYAGGGRASARAMLPCVVAGAIAKQILSSFNISISSSVVQIGEHRCNNGFPESEIDIILDEVRNNNDTVGAVVHCVISNVPIGLGEPVFYKFHAALAHAMMSINAAKGFEYGDGFNSAAMFGSKCNDAFVNKEGRIRTVTNHSGGVQAGITNGEEIYFNVAFKPIASFSQPQNTVDIAGNPKVIEIKGRHDVCVVPRVLPIVESMAAITTLDFIIMDKTIVY